MAATLTTIAGTFGRAHHWSSRKNMMLGSMTREMFHRDLRHSQSPTVHLASTPMDWLRQIQDRRKSYDRGSDESVVIVRDGRHLVNSRRRTAAFHFDSTAKDLYTSYRAGESVTAIELWKLFYQTQAKVKHDLPFVPIEVHRTNMLKGAEAEPTWQRTAFHDLQTKVKHDLPFVPIEVHRTNMLKGAEAEPTWQRTAFHDLQTKVKHDMPFAPAEVHRAIAEQQIFEDLFRPGADSDLEVGIEEQSPQIYPVYLVGLADADGKHTRLIVDTKVRVESRFRSEIIIKEQSPRISPVYSTSLPEADDKHTRPIVDTKVEAEKVEANLETAIEKISL
ncbi:hypothetical protein BDZ45DRAFT_811804 [Acephala macrosclerotiorum]|nr:hypothetical protein BDZ45DRAFT_811804 [Acephala macrosclerotiorum]